MNKKSKKIMISVLSVVLIAGILFGGIYGGNVFGFFNKGNLPQYKPENVTEIADSPLKDKKIIFLGSSVTYGMQSFGDSFVEYLQKEDGIIPIKEAVSGTTLVDNGEKSYISRMKNNIDKDTKASLFICQLSTNDATKELPLGEISESKNINDFDTKMIIGAIEYIIAYAEETWNCPVAFYTGSDFGNDYYKEMIDALYKLQEKWGIGIIDLYKELDVNIDNKLYNQYMNDKIHPTRKGYKEWWTPIFQKYLYDLSQ